MDEYQMAEAANNPNPGDPVWHFFKKGKTVMVELLEHDGGERMPKHDTTDRKKSMCKTTHPGVAQAIADNNGIELPQKGGGSR